MENNIKVLIADENADFRRSCRSNLAGFGYRNISEAVNGEDALCKIDKTHPDVVLTDVWLSKLDCTQVIRGTRLLDLHPDGVSGCPGPICPVRCSLSGLHRSAWARR